MSARPMGEDNEKIILDEEPATADSRGRSRRPKSLNYRLMQVPDSYAGSQATYKSWRQDLRAYVAAQDDNVPRIRVFNDIGA